jgi:uncharacterized membrane protein
LVRKKVGQDDCILRADLQSAPPTLDQRLLAWLPVIFAVLSVSIGSFYVFLMPPLQVPDEFAHLYRAYGISEGHLVAPALTPIPASVDRLLSHYPPHLENAHKVTATELGAEVTQPLKPEEQDRVPNEGMNVNTWIPYVPSALVILLARLLHLSPLAILYLGRLTNLLCYTGMTWLSLRLLGSTRLVLFPVALMPMCLHQAGSLSWDSISFAIAFLFCALVVHYSRRKRPMLVRKDYLILAAGVLVVSLCKVDFVLAAMVLLIPLEKFGFRKRHITFLLVCLAVVFFSNLAWQYANRENLQLFKQSVTALYHTNFPANIWYLYYNTGYLINAFGRTVVQTGFLHLTELVGTFGWLFVHLPAWAVWLYVGLLLCVGLTGASALRLNWFQRCVLLGIVCAGSFGCMLAMWLETPDSYIHDAILHNVGTLYGLQGRHYIPFLFPGLLMLSNRYLRVRPLWLAVAAVVMVVLVNTVSLLAIRQAYFGV